MASQTLRWATKDDLNAVLALLEEYHYQEGLKRQSKERIRQLLEDMLDDQTRGKILLAQDNSEIVGYALVVRRPSFEWASEVAVLDEIFVKGKARDRGIGRRMISYVEEYSASQGIPAVTLEVSANNFDAKEFYRSVGFDRVDREIYARKVGGPR